ncbi:hypothetical protein Pyn_00500 [Prunus yedoensis var. nudiflora]|uniref:Uncharacterized protein n=1 Tax=Prunus yedoensis var. nudiflora TaxID=2094558 RepID=A0A314UR85_PRUYE|nr:hypothetical protein Pyn_00500 [Prunus yedoensis var. nudiflora]
MSSGYIQLLQSYAQHQIIFCEKGCQTRLKPSKSHFTRSINGSRIETFKISRTLPLIVSI